MTDLAAPRAKPLGSRRAFFGALGVALGLALAAQGVGQFMKNVNWDEFIFLKNVYLYLNEDLHRLIQTSYVHLFTWLPQAASDEVGQVTAGRMVMFAAWLGALWLLYRLARHYLAPLGALAGVALFALFSFNQYHAGSFRADNLLLPVLLAMLLTLSVPTPKRIVAAGALGGLGLALSIKAVLWIPPVLGLLLVSGFAQSRRPRETLLATGLAAVAALAVFAAILGLHSLTLTASQAEGEAVKVSGTSSFFSIFWEMFVSEGLFPRGRLVLISVTQNVFIWMLIVSGAAQCIQDLRNPERRQRAKQLLWLATPILFLAVYHNAWPYAYLVLMPTACLLGGYALSELATAELGRKRAIAAVLLASVVLQAATIARVNLSDGQGYQKQVVSLVHEIFPDPVPYLDRTGMISSFPREMFTMTVYGLRLYRQRGEPEIARYIQELQPPLLLANTKPLDVWSAEGARSLPPESRLFPEDEAMLEATYAHFWGAIYLAGREWRDLAAGESRQFELTMPGTYSLLAEAPVTIDGQEVSPGDSLELRAGAHELTSLEAQVRARLLWGKGLEEPEAQPLADDVWGF